MAKCSKITYQSVGITPYYKYWKVFFGVSYMFEFIKRSYLVAGFVSPQPTLVISIFMLFTSLSIIYFIFTSYLSPVFRHAYRDWLISYLASHLNLPSCILYLIYYFVHNTKITHRLSLKKNGLPIRNIGICCVVKHCITVYPEQKKHAELNCRSIIILWFITLNCIL